MPPNPPNTLQTNSSKDKHIIYSIWKRLIGSGLSQETGTWDQFYNDAVGDFIGIANRLACAIICCNDVDYKKYETPHVGACNSYIGARVYTQLNETLVGPEADTICPISDIPTGLQDEAHQAACDSYFASGIMDNKTHISAATTDNIICCYAYPNIVAALKGNELLDALDNTVRFGILLPYINKKYRSLIKPEEYDNFLSAISDIVDCIRRDASVRSFTKIKDHLKKIPFPCQGDDTPKLRLFLFLPYGCFDEIYRLLETGVCPYIDRIIKAESYYTARLYSLAECQLQISELIFSLRQGNITEKDFLDRFDIYYDEKVEGLVEEKILTIRGKSYD